MADVSNNDLMVTLLAIKQDIGELQGDLRGHATAFAEHLKSDAVLTESVRELELAAAKQRGFIRAIGLVGSGLGAAVGYLLEKLMLGHH
jgi:hypothetical protein